MLKVKNYDFVRRTYPEAAFITSDFGGGIGEAEDDALRFAVKPAYFEDEHGRHYFDLLPNGEA